MRAGLDKVTRNFLPGSIGDFCNYDDPKLNALVDQVRQLDASSKEYQQAWLARRRLHHEERAPAPARLEADHQRVRS